MTTAVETVRAAVAALTVYDTPDNLVSDVITLVNEEHLYQVRWGTQNLTVFKVGEDFVGVEHYRPSGDGEFPEPHEWDVYAVQPVQIVHYEKVTA